MGSAQSVQTRHDQENINKHFYDQFSECYFNKKQYITIVGYQPWKKEIESDMTVKFQVDDSTLIEDLKKEWLEEFKDDERISKYDQDEFWVSLELRRFINKNQTIGNLKSSCQIRQCNAKVVLYIIFPHHFPLIMEQSAVNYDTYQQMNYFEVQTTFKILPSSHPQGVYFTLITPREIKIADLKTRLENHLFDQSIRITYDFSKGYRLKIRSDSFTKQHIGNTQLVNKPIKQQKGFFNFTELSNFNLRQICPPGEVIYFEPVNQGFLQIVENQPFNYDVRIHMTCAKKVQNGYERLEILSNYRTIRNITVAALLTEHRVYDAMFTSLSIGELIIKPFEKFSVLDDIISQRELETYELIPIPQNLLFYAHQTFSNNPNYLNLIQNLYEKHIINEQNQNNQLREKFISRRDELVKNVNEPKNTNLVQTILLYTGPFLYKELNKFLRNNSMAFVKSDQLTAQNWQYPYCQKIVKYLDKFPNYQGLVYRGSSGYRYKMTKGEVIQWNGFTSTTNNITTAQNFISTNFVYPYIFKIEVFSGKYIANFSFYKNESEVLILPYTKFKILDITLKEGINYVQMKQLSLPKKIPGKLIVWVDMNYRQNASEFYEIARKNNLSNVQIVQLNSNEHLQMWLQQYSTLINLPLIDIAFITNMNRPPHFQNEGIQTFKIIRQFSTSAKVAYYVQQLQQRTQTLRQAGIEIDNKSVFIASKKAQLQEIIMYRLWERMN